MKKQSKRVRNLLETYKEYYHDMSLFSSHQFSLEKLSGDFKDTLDKKDERILFVMKKKL